jgi:hypothetical protein
MNGRIVVFGALVVLTLQSCGGNVEHSFVGEPGGSNGQAGSAGGRAGTAGGGRGGTGQAGATTAGSAGSPAGSGGAGITDAGFDEYVDPGCPDAQAPPGLVECDPLAVVSGCAPGYGCYPYVEHPFGSGCGQQSYGARCVPPGLGVQGDPCGDDSPILDYCAPGYVSVIGVRPGKRCVKLCPLSGPNTCPAGTLCGDLDVEGYGVCG